MNYKQIFAIKERLKKELLTVNPELNNRSGIYWLIREENGFQFCYVGQAKHLLDRLISHLQGYKQHIDLSLKKHGLYNEEKNPNGWQIKCYNCDEYLLDENEQLDIKRFATTGYQMLNKTSGSQGVGKTAIVDNERKGYLIGKQDGKNKQLKEIRVFFDKYLDAVIKGKPNKIKERKLKEFMELIYGETETISSETKN